jgi:hypothetical protein
VTHLRKIMLEELSRSSQTGERLVQRRPDTRLPLSEPGKNENSSCAVRYNAVGSSSSPQRRRRCLGSDSTSSCASGNMIPITIRLAREDQDGNNAPAIRSVYCSCHYLSFLSF